MATKGDKQYRKFNRNRARAYARVVAEYTQEELEELQTAFTPREVLEIAQFRKAVIQCNAHTPAYIRMLADHAVNRLFCLMFQRVTRNNLTDFLNYPHNYITVPDMYIVQGLTGVSCARQVQLLTSGLLETDPYGARRYTPETLEIVAKLALLKEKAPKESDKKD